MPNYNVVNQTPEQNARDIIDRQLTAAGWAVQKKTTINWHVSAGIAVMHYQMKDGTEADYVLFVDRKSVGIIEAKREEEGHHLSAVEDQSSGYAVSKLKHLNNNSLPFVIMHTYMLKGKKNARFCLKILPARGCFSLMCTLYHTFRRVLKKGFRKGVRKGVKRVLNKLSWRLLASS